MRDDGPGGQAASCKSCGTELSANQHYCLSCGTRIGVIPAAFARWLSGKKGDAEASPSPPAEPTPKPTESPTEEPAGGDELAGATFAERYTPEPRSAAIATMALLAFGVIIGAATGPLAQSAAVSPIIVEVSPEATAEATPPVEEEPELPLEEVPGSPENVAPQAPPEPVPEVPHPVKPPPEIPTEPLPPITHVFMIVLGDAGYEETYGESSQATYLSQTLREQGELLENYYAVTQGDLANEIALLSGQGPTPATAAGCPNYSDVGPATVGAEEQVEGDGCAYPEATKTLPGQLIETKKTWKAYVEGGGGCSHEDPRGPFAFFHSIADKPDCADHSVDLVQLTTDLASETTTPSLSYIVPAAGENEQQLLEQVVPEIEESTAYKVGGLIAILSAQAPQGGPNADASTCCGTPEYPNLSPQSPQPAATGPVKPSGGGGHVGLLLISPFVTPGTVNESGYYNHFALLRSIEELFGLPSIGYAANPVLTVFDSSVYNLSS
jgi:hypothetical protein